MTRLVLVGLGLVVLAACGSSTTKSVRAPADSATPASGACATATGSLATITLEPDVPQPRCVQVGASQRLQVVNHTAARVTAHLGNEQKAIEPGGTALIDRPLGDYLESGVHRLRVDGYVPGGAEVWLGASSSTTATAAPARTTTLAAACSAASLSPELPSDAGLPPAVATMRDDLARAAVACDFNALAALADRNGPGVRYSFGPGNDPIGFWRTAEEGGHGVPPLRALRLLLGLPSAQQRLGDGTVQYVWPAAFASEHPTDADLQQVAATGLYDMATLEGWVQTGNNYLGYRVLITAIGDWTAFVAGD